MKRKYIAGLLLVGLQGFASITQGVRVDFTEQKNRIQRVCQEAIDKEVGFQERFSNEDVDFEPGKTYHDTLCDHHAMQQMYIGVDEEVKEETFVYNVEHLPNISRLVTNNFKKHILQPRAPRFKKAPSWLSWLQHGSCAVSAIASMCSFFSHDRKQRAAGATALVAGVSFGISWWWKNKKYDREFRKLDRQKEAIESQVAEEYKKLHKPDPVYLNESGRESDEYSNRFREFCNHDSDIALYVKDQDVEFTRQDGVILQKIRPADFSHMLHNHRSEPATILAHAKVAIRHNVTFDQLFQGEKAESVE